MEEREKKINAKLLEIKAKNAKGIDLNLSSDKNKHKGFFSVPGTYMI
jgi:hypothetical protein